MTGQAVMRRYLGGAGVIALLLLYLAVHLYFSRYESVVPDENVFLSEARQQARYSGYDASQLFIHQTNHLGYGSLYWISYILTIREFGETTAFAVFRTAAAVIMALFATLLVFLVRDRGPAFQASAVLLWATTPMAWWSGKVTGPEMFSLGFLALACYLAFRPERKGDGFGWHHLLMGISVGLKLNALPVAAGVLLWDLLRGAGTRRMVLFVALVLAGFLVANPFLLVKPTVFMANLQGISTPIFSKDLTVSWFLEHLRTITWNYLYEWDLVFCGGYFQWGLSIGAWALLWWMLRKQKVPAGILTVFVLASLLSAAMVILNFRYFGWYWLPLILFQLFLVVRLPVSARTLVALAVINVLFNAQVISHTLETRKEANENLLAFPPVKRCVAEHLDGKPADLVVDRMEIAYWNDDFDPSLEYQKRSLRIHYLLGDRLMKFSAYQRSFGDLLLMPHPKCGYVSIVTVSEPFARYRSRMSGAPLGGAPYFYHSEYRGAMQ